MLGKIDGSPIIVGGLLGDCQIISLIPILMKDNKTSRRVGVLGLRTCIILMNKLVVKWVIQLALVHCIVGD